MQITKHGWCYRKQWQNKTGILRSINTDLDQAIFNVSQAVVVLILLTLLLSLPLVNSLNLQGLCYPTNLVAYGRWWWSLYPTKVEAPWHHHREATEKELSLRQAWKSWWVNETFNPVGLLFLLFSMWNLNTYAWRPQI